MKKPIERCVDEYGRVLFHGNDAIELLLRGLDLPSLLIESNDEIVRYNQLCNARDKANYQISETSSPIPLSTRADTWFIPEHYRNISVREELLARCSYPKELDRVNMEMDLFEARGLLPMLQLMLYLVDHFRENGIIWGVGRGSSVASYCLFLIGVHKINSLYYDLSIGEFLK